MRTENGKRRTKHVAGLGFIRNPYSVLHHPFLCLVSCVLCLSSCTYSEFNLASGQEETLLYNTEKEEKIGSSVSAQMEQHFKVADDYEQNERLTRILKKITDVCDRKDLVYTVRILDEDEVNAVSLPGGYVYMFQGLVDKLKTDDELAAVIAHEVGHITARHALKRLQASYGALLLQLGAVASNNMEMAQGIGAAYQTVFLAYSRQDEFQADKLSVKYLKAAGYDPKAIIKVLAILQEEQRKSAPHQLSYFRTHPYAEERMAVVKKEISGQLDFDSYLDLTGEEKDLY